MQTRNAIRLCLNFPFEDTPEGKFLETIIAATGTLEREQNGRQVLQKMKARMEQGFWVFCAPLGPWGDINTQNQNRAAKNLYSMKFYHQSSRKPWRAMHPAILKLRRKLNGI